MRFFVILLLALLGASVAHGYAINDTINNVTDCDVTPCQNNGGSCKVNGGQVICHTNTKDKNSLCVRRSVTSSATSWDNPQLNSTTSMMNGVGNTVIQTPNCGYMLCTGISIEVRGRRGRGQRHVGYGGAFPVCGDEIEPMNDDDVSHSIFITFCNSCRVTVSHSMLKGMPRSLGFPRSSRSRPRVPSWPNRATRT